MRKVKASIFFEERVKLEEKLNRRLPLDLENLQKLTNMKDLFDYSSCKDKINKFWEKEEDIEFYEEVFICFFELLHNE